ncbi:NAD(P)-dependent oxidoreductase [Acetobacter fallax]|uniref:NAD-dependent epimerase/dehydratase domain-containing protein n=1 Tax=Acetobacter fallax TaxID=1737473 RepID=A0ABX0KE07_9PROT|nr:NAD(P)-dependent oxidoreductase [Acetobacter fallax]NHO34351.1 hypothetical protein [Acetobacter fallax]NHO37920.1 hypothetical protein [Acetobacter fallax]
MTQDALIGHTGFVGGNLLKQRDFKNLYNSKNIADIKGQEFGDVVCAGVMAVKWWANQNPDEDQARIEALIADLDTITTDHFTLISTVDVYGVPAGLTENDKPTREGLHPYGANRLMLEKWVAKRFDSHQIVRLPALFGTGLKKNVIFDMMTGHMLEVINGYSTFQWYPLRRLAHDLATTRRCGVVNLVTEPVATETIRARFFHNRIIGDKAASEQHYDLRTKFGSLFGETNYILSQDNVLSEMEIFLNSCRTAGDDA